MTSTNEIRRSFLDYFGSNGHEVVPSASLVPHNDPTLMFTNAGMVPFKNVFTGLESRAIPRATSSQKCVRAGGKHNDLDNVGYTARHHTFFEMLGNFSFGDYFKEQAIQHAWTLLTKEWGLPKDKLLVTVYHADDEAFALWGKIAGLPDDRIIRIPTSDNFWSMGDTGPCGPCSEIFYDHGGHIPGGRPGSPEEDGDRYIEIWNLVFMQFEQAADGSRTPLPKPSIDTGMGLERIATVMQALSGSKDAWGNPIHDNYDTDTFKALIKATAMALSKDIKGTVAPGVGGTGPSYRVIADHLRSTCFMLADGVLPANEGRGYVLRRIMRRAMRHAHLLGATEPLMHRLVPDLVTEMGQAFPELGRAEPLILEVLEREETKFRQTLQNGLKLLDDEVQKLTISIPSNEATLNVSGPPSAGGIFTSSALLLPGKVAFKLYDTYGFPYDLTEDALRARGIGIDKAGFDAAMTLQKAAARAAWKGSGQAADSEVWFDIAEREGATEFTGYIATTGEAQIVALVRDGKEVQSATTGDSVTVITNQTPFYGESGGQSGDAGVISGADGLRLAVRDTAKPLGRLHAHNAVVEAGSLKIGDIVKLDIDIARRDAIRANHSATHLLHAALRNRLGAHVTQKGSLVAADRLRFDFSQSVALTADDIAAVEAEVNAEVRANDPVVTRLMSPEGAIEAGAMALFGERYGDEVRVLSMGRVVGKPYSVELCGGTHVRALGDIGLLRIVSESAVSSGVRRIEALTGEKARKWLVAREDMLKATASLLRTTPDEVETRVAALLDERKKLERELGDLRRAIALSGGIVISGTGTAKGSSSAAFVANPLVHGVPFAEKVLSGFDPKGLRSLVDEEKARLGSGIAAIVTIVEGRATIAVGVTDDLTAKFSAVDLVRAGVEALGGKGGGGRTDMAQGGGPDGAKAAEAIAAVRALLEGSMPPHHPSVD